MRMNLTNLTAGGAGVENAASAERKLSAELMRARLPHAPLLPWGAVFVVICMATREQSLSLAAPPGFPARIGIDTERFSFHSPLAFSTYQTKNARD